MRGTTLTHAARRRSSRTRASFSASSWVAHVLRTTILSVIPKKIQSKSAKQCYYYLPGPHHMKAPLTRLAYIMAFFMVVGYAFFTLRGPKGIPGLLDRQRQIQEMEKRNTALAREIEQK